MIKLGLGFVKRHVEVAVRVVALEMLHIKHCLLAGNSLGLHLRGDVGSGGHPVVKYYIIKLVIDSSLPGC